MLGPVKKIGRKPSDSTEVPWVPQSRVSVKPRDTEMEVEKMVRAHQKTGHLS